MRTSASDGRNALNADSHLPFREVPIEVRRASRYATPRLGSHLPFREVPIEVTMTPTKSSRIYPSSHLPFREVPIEVARWRAGSRSV